MIAESTTLILLVILVLGLLVSELFRKVHLPYVSALILIGALFGQHGLDLIHGNEVIDFFGFLGFTFLMFMAGLETEIGYIKKSAKSISLMAIGNGLVPFFVGLGITRAFGYDWLPSVMVGVIFISSSIAIIIPAIRSAKLFKTLDGQKIVSAVVIEDMISLLALAFLLQSVTPITSFPLPIYFLILIVSVVVLKWILPRLARAVLTRYRFRREKGQEKEKEEQLRFVIVVLIAVLVFFSGLGVHPILAAFLVGLLLSDVMTSPVLREKIHTLGYGLFVPVFFFIVGMEIDFSLFTKIGYENVLLLTLIFGAISSKFFSGYIFGRLGKLQPRNATFFGLVSSTQLTTTLAATYAASSVGILDSTLTTAIVIISVITTIFMPILSRVVINAK